MDVWTGGYGATEDCEVICDVDALTWSLMGRSCWPLDPRNFMSGSGPVVIARGAERAARKYLGEIFAKFPHLTCCITC